MEENNQEEKTVEQEVIEEQLKKENSENTEAKPDEEGILDLTKEEVKEEEKFQEVINTAKALDNPEKVEQQKEEIISESEKSSDDVNTVQEVPDIEPAENTETSEEKTEIPAETSNVIKDMDMIFLQYECENPECKLKFYINNTDKDIGDKLKCYSCGKKLQKKKRLFDVTIKQYRDYEEN